MKKVKNSWLRGGLISVGIYLVFFAYFYIRFFLVEACWTCLIGGLYLNFPCLIYDFGNFCILISLLTYFTIGALIGFVIQKIKH